MKLLTFLSIMTFSVFASNDCEYLLQKSLMDKNDIITIKLADYQEAAEVARDRGTYEEYEKLNNKYGEIRAKAIELAKAVCNK